MGITKLQKVLIGLGLTGTALLLSVPLLKAASTGANLIIELSGRIHKISSKGLTLAVDVKMKNPTEYSLTFLFPFVKLIWKESEIMSSVLSSDSKVLEKRSEIRFPIYFELSFMSLFTTVPSLFKEYTSTGVLSLHAVTSTKVLASDGRKFIKPIPIEKSEPIRFTKST